MVVPTIDEDEEDLNNQNCTNNSKANCNKKHNNNSSGDGDTSNTAGTSGNLQFGLFHKDSIGKASNYISSILQQASISSAANGHQTAASSFSLILDSIKKQYFGRPTAATMSRQPDLAKISQSCGKTGATKRDLTERQLSDASFFTQQSQQQAAKASSLNDNSRQTSAGSDPSSSHGQRPQRPPLPPRELLANITDQPAPNSVNQTECSPIRARRHAIQEQSLERDAALSLKVSGKEQTKHKRTSSIKSALKHASHLAPHLRHHHHDSAKVESVKTSMPYESLFEPTVTQRTFQRSKRRDAMLSSDPKRQLSADTIALRQLTDEYLRNAGVKTMSTSNQCSLVALTTGNKAAPNSTGVAATVLTSGSGSGIGAACSSSNQFPAVLAGQQPACSIESQLYKASKQLKSAQQSSQGSEDSLSQVVILPGNLPWQSDVSIQCELLQAPSIRAGFSGSRPSDDDEEFESTGDILKTIAGPFRGSTMQLSEMANNSLDSNNGVSVTATLKRGLSAISQHHLSPAAVVSGSSSAALQVVGNLKKSLSNTLDISASSASQINAASAIGLHSQDSLPAYSSFQNEPEEDEETCNGNLGSNADNQDAELSVNSNSLIGHLASKLSRQSSKKFSASKKGLQRALSFDCRGYKRLEVAAAAAAVANQHRERQDSAGSKQGNQLLSSKHRLHNKSTLGLNSDLGPRPYLPQSASQVDFQVPLLPYHKMQEAIVSQRLLDPNQKPPATASSQAAEVEPQPARDSLDADQLICGPNVGGGSGAQIEPWRGSNDNHNKSLDRARGDSSDSRRSTAPKLVLDIPTIQTGQQESSSGSFSSHEGYTTGRYRQSVPKLEMDQDDGGEEASALNEEDKLIVFLPSPNVAISDSDNFVSGTLNTLSQSPSFCIDPMNKTMLAAGQSLTINSNPNQLNANDVFSQRSQNLIKRPSTMLVGDEAMSQVAKALNSTTSASHGSSSSTALRRSRRQAIVPPKMATDATGGDPIVGELVDVDDDDEDYDDGQNNDADDDEDDVKSIELDGKHVNKITSKSRDQKHNSAHREEADARPYRRKRSGGNEPRKLSNSQSNLIPTFHIEPTNDESNETAQQQTRPNSQVSTNAEGSIVSSGSSNNLSLVSGRNSRTGFGDLTITSPGGLTVSFNSSPASSRARRRSSIAVIPQMQICPGDLLVYSKQLIDRMNQNDDQQELQQFLTIDDKKGKNNIWSSLKLCAQFDNRTMKARNELLCSLEDVLASLQPSTFVDEQLSHYKGMLWNEFLYETESRRSASSEGLSIQDSKQQAKKQRALDDLKQLEPIKAQDSAPAGMSTSGGQLAGDNSDETGQLANNGAKRESLKMTMSSGAGSNSPSTTPLHLLAKQQQNKDNHASSGAIRGAISNRFKEKPKLKRGQTVDSVFRIPLIPSSPLKHAQLHQQTPTAHLEQQDNEINELMTITDDNESINSSISSRDLSISKHNRSLSTRSSRAVKTSRVAQLSTIGDSRDVVEASTSNNNNIQLSHDRDSSFDIEDTMDLICDGQRPSPNNKPFKNSKFARQSSLSTLSSTITRTEQKRQRALWDLFQSECAFFFDHLLTLKNVYMEPLKKIQVEGFAMFADPDVLFGNLDELCCGVYDFCKEFLYIIMRTLKTRPEELNATDVLIKLYKKNPKIDHLRGVYHRYTLNYINALTYLESLRKQIEFVEFEKWSSRDVRCKKLQLTDLLVAPVQHIMRVPIILKDIESHTENQKDREEIRAILAVEEASLRELDDKMRWLKNFERLLEIQKNINWPSVIELDSKLFIPEFLKEVLSKQPCERLIVSPRRQIVHEGTLSNLDSGKASDMHVILFDDMLLLTRRKKGLVKKASTVCKSNSGSSSNKDDGSYKYIVYKQPLSLDRFYVHDVQQADAQSIGLKHLFLLIVMNRFQQISCVHSFAAQNDDIKQTWLFKIKKTSERWKKNFSNSGSTDQQQQQLLPSAPVVRQQPIVETSRSPNRSAELRVEENQNSHSSNNNNKAAPIELIVTTASGTPSQSC